MTDTNNMTLRGDMNAHYGTKTGDNIELNTSNEFMLDSVELRSESICDYAFTNVDNILIKNLKYHMDILLMVIIF